MMIILGAVALARLHQHEKAVAAGAVVENAQKPHSAQGSGLPKSIYTVN